MKIYCKIILTSLLFIVFITSCNNDLPIDEDGLLITERTECYVSNFELLGVDYKTVRANNKNAEIDTLACSIKVEVKWGTDLKNLYPQFTLVTDAKLEPKVTGVTDFSNLDNPKKYTVISGNRKIRKTYTIYITEQSRENK